MQVDAQVLLGGVGTLFGLCTWVFVISNRQEQEALKVLRAQEAEEKAAVDAKALLARGEASLLALQGRVASPLEAFSAGTAALAGMPLPEVDRRVSAAGTVAAPGKAAVGLPLVAPMGEAAAALPNRAALFLPQRAVPASAASAPASSVPASAGVSDAGVPFVSVTADLPDLVMPDLSDFTAEVSAAGVLGMQLRAAAAAAGNGVVYDLVRERLMLGNRRIAGLNEMNPGSSGEGGALPFPGHANRVGDL